MRISTVTLTPSEAEKLLLDSAEQRQRPIDQKRVRLYAAKMRDGQWAVTHQAIAIDKSGILIDGQHRVAAVALAGIPVDLTIARDADPATFDVIDVGRTRSPGQTLAIAGYGNGNVLAAAARYLLMYRLLEGTTQIGSTEVRGQWTSHDILRYIESGEGDWLLGAMTDAQRLASAVGRQGIKTWASASIAILNMSGADPVLRLEFLEKLEAGTMLSPGSPILALRRWLTSDTGYIRVRNNVRGISGMANFTKAWNAFIEGDEMHLSVFKPGSEALPRLEARRTPTLLDATA